MYMKKIKFPLFLKIFALFAFILGVSLSAYVYYAINIFKTDKISYVYELVDDESEKNLQKLNQIKQTLGDKLNQFTLGQIDYIYLKKIVDEEEYINSFFELGKEKIIISEEQKKISEVIEQVNFDKHKKPSFKLVKDNFVFYLFKESTVVGFIGKVNALLEGGNDYLYKKDFLIPSMSYEGERREIYKYLEKKEFIDLTFYFKSTNGHEYIISSKKQGDLILLIMADYQKALSISKQLIENSIYFAGIVLGLVLILLIIFTSFLMKPVHNLTAVAKDFLSSNFKTRASTSSNDEIGFLSKTFNQMADDINQYMLEIEEKIKIEQELETAKLVQSQFFPSEKYENSFCEIFGNFKSAGHCGGDWWGIIPNKGQTLLIISDVTGHGTPAALMTAILHSSINNLKRLIKYDKDYLANTNMVMSYLNQCFCESTKSLNATAFVLSYDHETRVLTYTNASHNSPFLFSGSKDDLSKSDLVPLLENNGARLGEDQKSNYEQTSITLKKHDKLILYTDGILEELDENNKAYGQRRFIKAILKSYKESPEVLISQILKDFYDTIKKSEVSDDLTLVGFEVKK